MNKSAIIAQLDQSFAPLFDLVAALEQEAFEKQINDKWSAGQQLLHIYLSLKPLSDGLGYPKMAIKMMGTSDKPVKTYDQLVTYYEEILREKGAPKDSPYTPDFVKFDQKQVLLDKVKHKLDKLIEHLDKFSEDELDAILLPHPLIGKIVIREMLYFTIYHTQHHIKKTKENL